MRDAIQRMEARTPMTEASVGFIRVRKRKLKAEYHYLATMSSSFETRPLRPRPRRAARWPRVYEGERAPS
jgi:hypothetical protein